MPVRVAPLTAATWQALETLFREGGDPRWCWCQFWRLRSKDFGTAKVTELRARLRAQAESQTPPGLIAFEGDGPGDTHERAVGWVSLGPRVAFERIVRSKVIPTIDDRPVWSIVCFAVSASARGRGVARSLLEGAIAYAREHGVEALEAYPVDVDADEDINPDAAFTGTLPMFERAGFTVVAERASDPSSSRRRVVVRRELR
ncbi:MAG: GNAT family N-acetyltransferase [Anaerolinea sp.]|nr:GNAT family N-acetyltransferase [Anaerolinea sp.]